AAPRAPSSARRTWSPFTRRSMSAPPWARSARLRPPPSTRQERAMPSSAPLASRSHAARPFRPRPPLLLAWAPLRSPATERRPHLPGARITSPTDRVGETLVTHFLGRGGQGPEPPSPLRWPPSSDALDEPWRLPV